MSDYLITREGQELGSYSISQIQDGLKTGHFKSTDWGWQEGMENWKALTEIAGPAPAGSPGLPKPAPSKTISSPLSAPVKRPVEVRSPDGVNPYSAPVASIDITGFSGAVPPSVVAELKGTKPWVRLISVFMWLGVLLMVAFVVINIMFGAAIAQASGAGALGSAYVIGTTIGYGLATLLLLYPTLKLTKYASNISSFTQTRSFVDLALALAEQRRFWKFYGIIILIQICIMVLGIAAMVVFMPKNLKLPAKGSVSSAPALELRVEGRHGKA